MESPRGISQSILHHPERLLFFIYSCTLNTTPLGPKDATFSRLPFPRYPSSHFFSSSITAARSALHTAMATAGPLYCPALGPRSSRCRRGPFYQHSNGPSRGRGHWAQVCPSIWTPPPPQCHPASSADLSCRPFAFSGAGRMR